jgi:hypothetical protein
MNKTRKVLLLTALAIIPTIQAVHAQSITYDWTETGNPAEINSQTYYGDASGTLTISTSGVYASGRGKSSQFDYAITDFSGEFTTGPDAGTTFNSTSLPFPSDPRGFLVFGTANSPSPSSLKGASFVFTADINGDNFDITGDTHGGYTVSEDENSDAGGDAFSICLAPLAPVPESPVNPAVLAAAGLFIGWRSRRTVRNVRA